MRYISKHQCPKCQQKLIYDNQAKTLSCKCGSTHCTYVNLSSFQELGE